MTTPNKKTVSRKTRTRRWFTIYFAVVLSPVLFPPFLEELNRAKPFIGPFPFFFAAIIGVAFLMCAGLIALFEIERRRGDLL